MGALVVRFAWAWLLLLQLAGASHVVYRDFETEAATEKVPPSIVDPLLRTGYHFQPPKNWINGNLDLLTVIEVERACFHAMYYEGWYHFFYQYNPEGAVWDNIVWAHSVSRDLINWHALETAIEPSIPADKYGCWSGSATTMPDGTPVIMYTGVNSPGVKHQVQNIAYPKNASDPMLREWVKPDHNPVIVPETDINATEFRDPTTAWLAGDDGHWRLLVGSAARGRLTWRGLRVPEPRLQGVEEGEAARCTRLPRGCGSARTSTRLDVRRYDYYTVGTYDQKDERYVPDDPAGDEHHLRYDYGNFYASKTFYDPAKQRRVLWGWANESDTRDHDVAKGWAGIQAIPRKVWLDFSGKQLLQWPIEEVEALRHQPVTLRTRADVEVTFELSSLDCAEPLDPALAHDAERLCGCQGR
ncbi:hypothetical protein HU200_005428 [Digitaria exilis]|uniref:Glycosyl hydrolase family 32 N-terminal domain-containing protein n=1 Tax=Digitaria exilis TaxID=1010633 RepID=A0A835FUE9_9POAL|nr:hypothetical protein HU200_005428 [Digitaria exilis]